MILTYHKIGWRVRDNITVNLFSFAYHMLLLCNKKVVHLDDYDPNNENHVVITFDDGYKEVATLALPILCWFRYPFEVFLVENFFRSAETGSRRYLDSKDLKKIICHRGRLQYHTKSHPQLDKIDVVEALEKEIRVPDDIKLLDDNGFRWFAYPFWTWNQKVIGIVGKYYQGARSGNGFAETGNPYALDSKKMG